MEECIRCLLKDERRHPHEEISEHVGFLGLIGPVFPGCHGGGRCCVLRLVARSQREQPLVCDFSAYQPTNSPSSKHTDPSTGADTRRLTLAVPSRSQRALVCFDDGPGSWPKHHPQSLLGVVVVVPRLSGVSSQCPWQIFVGGFHP